MGHEKDPIRIKISPQLKSGSPSQHTEPATGRGKSAKRRLRVDSDDDDEPDPLNITPVSVRRIPPFKRSKTSEPTSDPAPAPNKGATTAAKRPRPKEPPNDEESTTVDVVNDSAGPTTILTPPPVPEPPEPVEVVKDKEPTPPPPKKRKLPTIRKHKASGEPTGFVQPVPTSTSGLSKALATGVGVGTGKAVVGADEDLKLPANAAVVRTPAALVGSADFDLRKPSVYAELFKTTGASTPRSGLNRREKDEERRKELNRMRDEAKSKRVLDAKQFFNLQGQWDKISRFEERLRHEKSSVLFPNILAAKLKDEWERERRRQGKKDKQMEKCGVMQANGKVKSEIEREEGELLIMRR